MKILLPSKGLRKNNCSFCDLYYKKKKTNRTYSVKKKLQQAAPAKEVKKLYRKSKKLRLKLYYIETSIIFVL